MEDSYPSYDVPDDHSWDEPVTDLKLLNLSDDQYLSRILGPRRMGLEVGGLTALQHLMFTIFDPDCCPNDCGVRDHLPYRGAGQHCCLLGDCEAEVHAHRHQLLPLFIGSG